MSPRMIWDDVQFSGEDLFVDYDSCSELVLEEDPVYDGPPVFDEELLPEEVLLDEYPVCDKVVKYLCGLHKVEDNRDYMRIFFAVDTLVKVLKVFASSSLRTNFFEDGEYDANLDHVVRVFDAKQWDPGISITKFAWHYVYAQFSWHHKDSRS